MDREIERKWNLSKIEPKILSGLVKKSKCIEIEQGYINFHPAVRVRKQNSSSRVSYVLTVKNNIKGNLIRFEKNIIIDSKTYSRLIKKREGIVLKKTRYLIPYKKHIIELDVFKKEREGLVIAEVEFKSENSAKKFMAPDWFNIGKEVTNDKKWTNAYLCQNKKIKF